MDASRVKVARPRRDYCLPSVGRTVTTTILLVYQQLPQQPCRSLKGATTPTQFLRSGVLGSPSLVRSGVLGSPPSLDFASFLSRLLRQAGPVCGQVAPHRDHVMSFSFCCPPLPGDGLPLTHSPRRELVSGSVIRRVPTPRLLGVLLWQSGLVSLGCQPGVAREPLKSSRIITCLISDDF